MWSILNGTFVNALTVLFGSLAGVALGPRLADRYREIVLSALGLVTLTLGVDAAVLKFSETVARFAPLVRDGTTYGARLAMTMIASLIVGALIGSGLQLHRRIEGTGTWLHGRFSTGDGSRFAEGFLTASVIFCVGPLTLLGCLRNGAHGNPDFLYVKALLDGFCSLALSATLGWGVLMSVLMVLVFQGGLSLLAHVAAQPLDEVSLSLMTVVGGVALLATSLMILEIKRIPVADLLPGVFLPPLFLHLGDWWSPGWLLPGLTAGS